MMYQLFAATIDANSIGIPKVAANATTLQLVFGLVYTVIGALSIFYIVRGALLFVTSNANPNDIKQARTTILMAVAALVGASAVFAIINFFIANIGG